MNIRKAKCNDLSRVAEIYVLNNRIHFSQYLKMRTILLGSCRWYR